LSIINYVYGGWHIRRWLCSFLVSSFSCLFPPIHSDKCTTTQTLLVKLLPMTYFRRCNLSRWYSLAFKLETCMKISLAFSLDISTNRVRIQKRLYVPYSCNSHKLTQKLKKCDFYFIFGYLRAFHLNISLRRYLLKKRKFIAYHGLNLAQHVDCLWIDKNDFKRVNSLSINNYIYFRMSHKRI
jgi:hypothetical protein